MKSFFLLLVLIPLLSFSQQREDSSKNKTIIYVIDLVEFKKQITNKVVTLIDVRTKREYNLGHIDQAINISIKNKRYFKERIAILNKLEPVYIYCHSGVRSKKASKILKKKGFKTIYDFKGGWKAWSK